MGTATVAQSSGAELLRLGALFEFGNDQDKRAAEEEVINLKSSLTILPLLPAAAEVSAKIKTDAEALESIKTPLIDTLLNIHHEESFEEEGVRPDTESSLEEWEMYRDRKLKKVYERTALTFGAAAVLAPVLSTYTSSNTADGLKEAMATEYAEMIIAREVCEKKSNGQDFDMQSVYKSAEEKTNEMLNSQLGLNNLLLTFSSNLYGNGFIGDPPYFFFAGRHPEEFIPASIQGLAESHLLGLVEINYFLSQYLGTSETFKHAKLSGTSFAKSMVKTIKGFGTIFQEIDQKKLLAHTENVIRQWEAIENAGPDIQNITQLMETLENSEHATPVHFAWDKTIPGRVATALYGEFKGKRTPEGEFQKAFRTFFKTLDRTTIPGQDGEAVKQFLLNNIRPLQEFLVNFQLNNPDTEKTEKIVKTIQDIQKEIQANTPESIAEAESLIQTLHISHPEQDIESLVDAIISDDFFEARKLLYSSDSLNIAPAIVELNQKELDHSELIADSTKEVALALATQLPAVDSLVTVFEWLLQQDSMKSVDFTMKSGIILASAAILSGFADNAAAYLFAETALLNLAKAEFGDTVKEKPDLLNALYRQAIYAAVVGGSLSLLGNGPNFLQKKHILSITEDGVLSFKEEQLQLQETLGNLYSMFAVATIIGIGIGDISMNLHKSKSSK